jgi:O-antigen ligase
VRNLVPYALFSYLGTLAITQTVYGRAFMSARWLALSLLLAMAGFSWFSTRSPRSSRRSDNSTAVVFVYLAMTFLSVITAENTSFSGLKWASHAAMIVVFLVFLWQNLPIKRVNQIINILKWFFAILIFLSWLKPMSSIQTEGQDLFRGIFGNPNAMGQVVAIGGLLFLHSFLTAKASWLRRAELIMAFVAAWLVWLSGARSAMVASITGLVLMNYFYPSKLRGKVFWVTLLAGGLALVMPDLPRAAKQFVLRGDTETKPFSEQIIETRAEVWKAAWEGFQKRPVFGWGFGADDRIPKQWVPKLTAIGTVSRDSVNDTLIVLESTGVVGLMAYILLVILSIKQIPTRQERFLLRKIHAPPSVAKAADFSPYHNHAIAFIIALTLLVTVQFDNTALSAGNFVSVTLWLCVALAGALKTKAVAYESAMARYQELAKRSHSQSLRDSTVSASVARREEPHSA